MARKQQEKRADEAVIQSLDRSIKKREGDIKPIEIVKIGLSSYLSFISTEESLKSVNTTNPESSERADLHRGNQAAIDRMLFNANYWRSAYEQQIINACSTQEQADECLKAVSVWIAHPLKLNTLSPEEVVSTFERFCPPFKLNNRRGATKQKGVGKGPLPDFKKVVEQIEAKGDAGCAEKLFSILNEMEAEAAAYDTIRSKGPLSALFDILPAWCLQNRLELVSGSWWEDFDVMSAIIDALYWRFLDHGFGEAACRYFLDSCCEALDAYHRDLSTDPSPLCNLDVPHLIEIVGRAREAHPNFETDGYENSLPSWLISKEQLVWNIIVCSIYGPASARPLLVDSPDLLASQGYVGKTDVITELAQLSFTRYIGDRTASQIDQEFASFSSLPTDLRNSSFAYIGSIFSKLETLGYEILPAGSCYPERCVPSFTPSEVECLAILEHRRWLRERQQSGWQYGECKDVDNKRSPYMVPWEELPERAREWNRSAVRSIPALLASVNLAIVK